DDADPAAILPPLIEGQPLDGKFEPVAKQTRPPSRHTEAALLSAMESAGKTLTDDELRAAMKDTGLGTPATRAAIIETLLKRGYIERDKKSLRATEKGKALIKLLPSKLLKSAQLTGIWDKKLDDMASNHNTFQKF